MIFPPVLSFSCLITGSITSFYQLNSNVSFMLTVVKLSSCCIFKFKGFVELIKLFRCPLFSRTYQNLIISKYPARNERGMDITHEPCRQTRQGNTCGSTAYKHCELYYSSAPVTSQAAPNGLSSWMHNFACRFVLRIVSGLPETSYSTNCSPILLYMYRT
jgi:hypothetical protein